MRSRRLIFLAVIIISLVAQATAYAQNAAVTNGIQWLTTNQNVDGSWGGSVTSLASPFETTFEVSNTFAAYTGGTAYMAGVQWTAGQEAIYTEILARKIILFGKNGNDTSADVAKLLSYCNSDGYWGEETDLFTGSNNLDTSLALQALKAVSYQDQNTISSAINYLTSTKNPDGGWGFYQGDESNVYMTAIVLQTLSQFKTTYDLKASISGAAAYLLSHQNPDGGFGPSTGSGQAVSTVYETALAFEALLSSGAVGAEHAPAIQSALSYLTNTQLPNGSWEDDPYSTALALRALASVKPNLSISSSDITFSNPTPTQGETVTITASIHNTGLEAAQNSAIQFFDGDPSAGGIQIGDEQMILSIAPYGAASVSVSYNTSGLIGRREIFVLIDTVNVIDEAAETDNTASNFVTISSLPDLSIDSSEITYLPAIPTADTSLEITFVIRNLGDSSLINVPVRFYSGLSGAETSVNDYTIPTIKGLGKATLTVIQASVLPGTQIFTLVADSDKIITEAVETNNAGSIAIDVAGSKGADLSIFATDISYMAQPNAITGDPLPISAIVHNNGSTDLQTEAAFYDGDPQAGGTYIGKTALTVPALGSATAQMNWILSQPSQIIYVAVDPDNTISETNETNNIAFRAVDPYSSLPDLKIDAGDISYHPQCITPQSKLTIEARAYNQGGTDSYAYLRLYDGSISKGNFSFPISPYVPAYGYRDASFTISSLTVGEHLFHIIADPTNLVQEISESNNSADLAVTVRATCETDLYVEPEDITFSPPLPLTGQQTTITAAIHNAGSEYLSAYVSFYNGNPSAGGQLIKRLSFTANQESSKLVSTTFVMPSRIPEIFVMADDDNRIQETDETNNSASKTIDTYRDDLSISSRDISLSPVIPSKGDVVTVNVAVHSSGMTEHTAALKLYEGRPEYGLLIGSQEFTISRGQTMTFSFPSYIYPGDGATLSAVIEDVVPAEDDLSNNSSTVIYGERIEDGASNEGTDFWLAWPPTTYRTADIIIQSKYIANVTAEIPVTGGIIKKLTGQVSPGNPFWIPLTDYYTRLSPDDISAIDNKAIHISSDKDISAVFHVPVVPEFADDSYLGLPTNLLGTEYYIMHYYPFVVNSIYQFPSNYSIVATEDNTNIRIGDDVINLSKRQTYHYNSNFDDLSGTHVLSDKPVAVIASATCSNVPLTVPKTGTCDSLMEQMLPSSQFGTDFYTAPLYSPKSSDVYRVLAKEDNTEITIKDRYFIDNIVLNKGQWSEFENEYEMHITTTKPIMVAQYAKGSNASGQGDPFQTTIIPTDKFRTEYRFYIYPYYEEGNFISLIIPDSDTSVLLDGTALDNSLWQPLPDKGKYFTMSVTEGEHVISADRPFEAYVHGYRLDGTYGHPAGFSVSVGNLKLNNPTVTSVSPTEGQLVEIAATLSNDGDRNVRDVIVRAYSGDPTDGGIQIGPDIYIPLIDAKESKTVGFTWDTFGYRGMNNIYIVADPSNKIRESNENDNALMITLDVTSPLEPDPSITDSDITLSKATANEGETVVLTAKIKNRGADVGNIPVSLYLGNPLSNGFLLESRMISPIMPLNGETVLAFQVSTVGLNDLNDLYAVIDPDNIINEILENNNIASTQLQINRKKLSVDVATDRNAYMSQSDVSINLSFRNDSLLPWSGTGDVYIEDINGLNIAHVATFTVDDIGPLYAEGYHYRIPLTLTATRTLNNALAFAYMDFTGIFPALGIPGTALDLNSIRVIETDIPGNFISEKIARFYKGEGFNAATNPHGNIVWLADGITPENASRNFYLYFDTLENGPKQPKTYAEFPEKGSLIAFTGYNGEIYTVRRYDDGVFGAPRLVDQISLSLLHGVTLRDFNNDGFPDLISGDTAGNIYLFRNTADGSDTFQPKVKIGSVWPGIASSKILQSITAADYNNDGNMDFVLNMAYSHLYLFLGNGDGTFEQSILMNNNTMIDIYGKASADFDEDGNMDFVIGDNHGNITIYYGSGDGAFGNTAVFGPITTNSMFYGIGAGDYDHNGHADIVINEYNYKKAYIMKGMAEGMFKAVEEIPLPSAGRTAYDLVDVNGDGVTDLLAAQEYPSILLYFEGNGDGTFGQPANLQSGAYYTTAVSASRNNPEITATIGAPEKIGGRLYNFTWNTGSTSAGNYKAHVTLSEGQTVVAEDYSSFEILPDTAINSKVVTDRISYTPNQAVTLTSTVTSQSSNFIMENLTATIAIRDQQSANILHTEIYAIPALLPNQLMEFRTYWNTSTNPAGAYPVTLEIRDASGILLSTSTATLTISGEIKPSKLLKGQITLDKQSIMQGEPLNISYQITNIGNMDLAQVDLSIKTVHIVQLSAYDTLTDQTALAMGATYANTKQLNTGVYTAKDYLVILSAAIGGVEETLASTYFRVEGAPSAPSLNAPRHGSDVDTFIPALIVNNASDPNDDRLVYEFELYADAGLSSLIAISTPVEEGSQITSWLVPFTLNENARYFWRARAYDGRLYGQWMEPAGFRVNTVNEPPTAPTLSSPADSSAVDTATPVLSVNNAIDPDSLNLTYNFMLALDPGFLNIIAAETGIFEGQGSTSWQPSAGSGQGLLILQENTWYYWTAQADDWLITGPWMPAARFFVNTTNEAPSVPVIMEPLDGSEVASTDVLITALNSTDPDSAVITYIFEADISQNFDSAEKKISGSLPQGSNTTPWLAAGLKDNTWYYARVKASDGQAESAWSAPVAFFVNMQNDAPTAPVLANPSDGSGVNSFNPVLAVHNSTDLDGDILTYEFEVYADASLSSLITSAANIQETTQVTGWAVPVSLTENSTYYWRARAFDGELYSLWMPIASFTVNTANDAPTAPTLSAPSMGSSLATLAPTLSIMNATDPDSDMLTYDFEIYTGTTLIMSLTGIPQDISRITSVAMNSPLSDNTTYQWRARAYDGDRYSAWMDMATFSIHMPSTNITATIEVEPETLNRKSEGNWISVEIELPRGYRAKDVQISSILLEGTVHAEPWPYSTGCSHDRDGRHDDREEGHNDRELRVKFSRSAVLSVLPNGYKVRVRVTGRVGGTTFEGVDYIRVMK